MYPREMFLHLLVAMTCVSTIFTTTDSIVGGKFRVYANNSIGPIRNSDAKYKTSDTAPKPEARVPQPFEFPSQEEIERLIRERGFALAVLGKLVELVYGILTAPFRWVYRVGEFFLTVLKLGAESFRQMGQRRKKNI